MDHLKILKRSWQILWQYRALWIFGIIIAITAAGGSGGSGANPILQFSGNNSNNNSFQPYQPGPGTQRDFQEGIEDLERLFSEGIPNAIGTTLIVLGVAFACLMILLAIVFTVLRYVSTTALIRMVDEHEQTEERLTVRQGFRIGWSRASWRIFLIDLVINIPAAILFILLFALALSPLLLWLLKSNAAGILGTIAAIGLFFLVLLVVIIVGTALTVLVRFFQRVCAIQDAGVFESIRIGYHIVRRNIKDTLLMWLFLFGLQFIYAIASAIAAFVLLIVAAFVAGGGALLFGGLGSLIGEGALPWIMGGVVGIPLFIMILALPLTFLNGLKEVYLSSAWTLTYREMAALEGSQLEPEALPETSEEDDPAPKESEG